MQAVQQSTGAIAIGPLMQVRRQLPAALTATGLGLLRALPWYCAVIDADQTAVEQ
jgi:hypothetical protein